LTGYSPLFLRILIPSLNAWIGSQENWTSAQKEHLTAWGVEIKKNRGAENSHWLKGDKMTSPSQWLIMIACRCVWRLAAAVITDIGCDL